MAYEGDLITYSLVVRNTGISLTTPITVTDDLPQGIVYEGGLCAASWGSYPVCQSDSLAWQDTLFTTTQVIISFSVRVVVSQPSALVNQMVLDAGANGQLTRAVTVIANPLTVFLPVTQRE